MSQETTALMAPQIAFQTVVITDHRPWAPAEMYPHTDWMIGQTLVDSQSTTTPTAVLMPSQAPITTFRNVSELFQAYISPATRAAIAMTTMPIGFAFRAALRSHWAAVQPTVATLAAPCIAIFAQPTTVWAAWAAVVATQAPAWIPSCTPVLTRFATNSPAYIPMRTTVWAFEAIIAAVLAIQAPVLVIRVAVPVATLAMNEARLIPAITTFQAVNAPTTASRTPSFVARAPKKLVTVENAGELATSLRNPVTPGMTDPVRVSHRDMAPSRMSNRKATRPLSSSSPNMGPVKSPFAMML